MKYLFVSIILLFTYFQQIDPKSIRLWSRYGPRQGGWGSNGVLGISPWSGSGRFSGMMAAMGPSAMSGIGGNGVGQFGGLAYQWNRWDQNNFWNQPQQLPMYQVFFPVNNNLPNQLPVAPVNFVPNQQPVTPVNFVTQNSVSANLDRTLPIDCKYTDSTKSVFCTGFGQSVSCDAIKIDNSTFKSFAVSAMPKNGEKPEDVRFPMYPLKSDKSGFLDSTVIDSKTNQTSTYSLFFSPLITDSGLKIKEPTCWNQMMDKFTAGVRSTFETNIKSALITVNKDDGSTEEVIALASVSWA